MKTLFFFILLAFSPFLACAHDIPTIQVLEEYLNSFRTLSAQFTQKNADGSVANGQFYLDRPNHLKFVYSSPEGYTILAKDGWLETYDPSFDDISYLELDFTPARFFLNKDIRLNQDIVVKGIFPDSDHGISLVLTDNNRSAIVVLLFSLSPLALRGWRIIESQGGVTELTLSELSFDRPIPNNIFTFTPKRRPSR